jgi:FtsP/CotA-like multicopper oxidase with cupredoxin domain
MKGASDMDGPVGITQRAIKPGQSFTYQVPIRDQAGTFWYHAHSEVHIADGLYGGLVVHDVARSETRHDEKLLFLVGDWYHRQAADVLAHYMRPDSEGKEVRIRYLDCSS